MLGYSLGGLGRVHVLGDTEKDSLRNSCPDAGRSGIAPPLAVLQLQV